MCATKRINQRIELDVSSFSEPKKRKEPTKPPRNAEEAQVIMDELYDRNPLLSLTASMSAMTGLRYSDASWLIYQDFVDEFGNWKDSTDVCQQKTFNMRIARGVNKVNAYKSSLVRVFINDDIKEIIEEARFLSCSDTLLFANSRSSIKAENGEIIYRPMSIQSANWHHDNVRKKLKLNYAFNTHSWRKFFAKKMVNRGASLDKVRDLLGQTSLNSTNHYLSSFDDELVPLIKEMRLFE